MRTREGTRKACVLGALAAILALQLALMPISTGVHRDWEAIARDSLAGPVVVQRWYFEGIATSHFSASGARLTGNPPLAGASVGVVLGDSYVEARQLPDRATIGSHVEQLARGAGQPLNIRQYGFSGASAAKHAH